MNKRSTPEQTEGAVKPARTLDILNKGLAKRYQKERRFKLYGLVAVVISVAVKLASPPPSVVTFVKPR